MNRRDIFKLFAGSAAIPAVKSVESLKINDGDIVVLKFSCRLTASAWQNITKEWRINFPDVRVVILENGADISVLRREQS